MVELIQELSGASFESWRLKQRSSPPPREQKLSLPVDLPARRSSGYLQTRAALQHNHLHCCNGRLFAFCTKDSSTVLQELNATLHSSQQIVLKADRVAVPGQQHEVLSSSLSAVWTAGSRSQSCLLSTGRGDLHLLEGLDASALGEADANFERALMCLSLSCCRA